MRTSNNRKAIIFLGPPGSGKGTQAELLAEKLNLYYFDTSKTLEEKFNTGRRATRYKAKESGFVKAGGKKYFLKDERKFWQTGKLCSPPFVVQVVAEKIKELYEKGKNLVLAGSPRTLYEAEKLAPLLKKLYGPKNIQVILLEISPEETIFRNSHRKLCELMRHPIVFSKETQKLTRCPLDGSRLVRRKGLDDVESIKVRLKEYKEKTYPVLQYFKKEKLAVSCINGSPPPAVVFEKVLQNVKK